MIQLDISLATTACMIVIKNGLILGVQQKSSKLWGLPGGKQEPGEPIAMTAFRETKEETWIIVYSARLVYVSMAREHVCACYLAEEYSGEPYPVETPYTWAPPEFFINPANTPWAEYNKAAFAAAGILITK